MKKIIQFVEYVSGGLLFIVMIMITLSAISRYLFNAPLLDGDDIARLLLLPAIFFGLAGCCQHDEHIRVDLLWEYCRHHGRRLIEIIAASVTALVMLGLGLSAIGRVLDIYNSGVGTYELRMPMWPFFALACIALLLCAVIALKNLASQVRSTSRRTSTALGDEQ